MTTSVALPSSANTGRILVIEDNALLAAGVRSNLEFEGYQVEVAGTGGEGLRLAHDRTFALVVLDLMLPDIDGFRVLRELREHGVETPVLILTALGDETDKVRGFRFGADDYVTKPFGLMEFLARVEALLRRSRPAPAAALPHVPLRGGDHRHHHACGDAGRCARDTPASRIRPARGPRAAWRRHRVTRRTVARSGGYDDSVVSRTVDTHMAELRRKLEVDPSEPRWLLTVRKTGHRLAAVRAE